MNQYLAPETVKVLYNTDLSEPEINPELVWYDIGHLGFPQASTQHWLSDPEFVLLFSDEK